jgi:hypothetical protein
MARLHFKSFKDAKQKGIDFFGVYLRFLRGNFSMTDNNTIFEVG